MKISELFNSGRVSFSFEVFPPKADTDFDRIQDATRKIAALKPDFMSVTYGAGGGTSRHTVRIAEDIQRSCSVPALAHLTCVSSTRDMVRESLVRMQQAGIENVLALRGDIPADGKVAGDYQYASQLIEDIHRAGDFCIGAACYPEGHIECANRSQDMEHLRQKVACGCDFLTTQMFFDNSVLYSFLYRMLAKGVDVPVIAGVMPVTNSRQITRACAMSGATLPARFRSIMDKFGEDPISMKQAGIAYATEQIVDLVANGVRGIHVYTMNKPDVATQLLANLSDVLGRTA